MENLHRENLLKKNGQEINDCETLKLLLISNITVKEALVSSSIFLFIM